MGKKSQRLKSFDFQDEARIISENPTTVVFCFLKHFCFVLLFVLNSRIFVVNLLKVESNKERRQTWLEEGEKKRKKACLHKKKKNYHSRINSGAK